MNTHCQTIQRTDSTLTDRGAARTDLAALHAAQSGPTHVATTREPREVHVTLEARETEAPRRAPGRTR